MSFSLHYVNTLLGAKRNQKFSNLHCLRLELLNLYICQVKDYF